MREAVSLAHPSSSFKASTGWIRGYKHRHPSCKLRVPTHTIPASKWSHDHVSVDIQEKVHSFHQYMDNLNGEHKYPLNRIINMDETPVQGKVKDLALNEDLLVKCTLFCQDCWECVVNMLRELSHHFRRNRTL
jgi:hypothetical protein